MTEQIPCFWSQFILRHDRAVLWKIPSWNSQALLWLMQSVSLKNNTCASFRHYFPKHFFSPIPFSQGSLLQPIFPVTAFLVFKVSSFYPSTSFGWKPTIHWEEGTLYLYPRVRQKNTEREGKRERLRDMRSHRNWKESETYNFLPLPIYARILLHVCIIQLHSFGFWQIYLYTL